jgi:DNA polymerase
MATGFWDIESRSTIALDVAGAWRYAGDTSTEILCIAYALDDSEPKIWVPGDPPPEELLTADEIVAHNFAFERAMAARILTPRHSWPEIPLSKQRCSMTLALAHALPAALDKTAKALGLPYQKNADDYRLMRRMSRPRRPRKNEDPDGVYWVDGPELRKQLQTYCIRDVEIERTIYRRLPPLLQEEQELWQLDATINARGFYVDTALTLAARDVARAEQIALNIEVAQLTNGEIVSINQVEKIKEFIRRHGHTIETLTRRSVSQVLRHDPSDIVRQLLELRRAGARASTRKFDSLLTSVDADSRLRGTLRFHGSSTGRWSGSRFQPQNLKKPEIKDLDTAVAAILAGDLARVRELGAPLTVAGDVTRAVVCAAPGHTLIGADLSAIESRILAWLAGEKWKIQAYENYDRTSDPKFEPYCVMASRALKRIVTPDDEVGRQFGKTYDLAFDFGGGLGAWRRFDDSGTYTDPEVEHFKHEFRRQHPETVKFWRRLELAAHRAIVTGRKFELPQHRGIAFAMENGTLLMTLPSGRRLSYPEAKLVPGKFEDTRQLRFKDNARGGWNDTDAWYGVLVENAVQATARDVLAAAMRRIEAAGYPIVLSVHDEVVAEIPKGFGSVEKFHRLMVECPPWAEGLPLAAKAWTRPRYAKASAPAQPLSPPDRTIERPPSSIELPSPAIGDDDGDEDADLSDALDTVPLADLISEPLISGQMCCPFHPDDMPSLRIYPDHYHCFGCGAHGNQIDWLTSVEGMDQDEAIAFLKNWDGPLIDRTIEAKKTETNRAIALRLWGEAASITGTLAERYLTETRGINLTELPTDIDAVLRFHPQCPFNKTRHPCLLVLMRDVITDEPTGIHRIALTPDAHKIDRWTLGNAGAVKMWPAGPQLVVGEGLETVLAAATRIPYEDAPLRPAWSLGSSTPLGQLPVIPGVERLIVLIDHDNAGIAAANAVTNRWTRARHTVVRLMPDEVGADFNDVVLAERTS